eukprot:8441715-Prorocentrum_lima.AAC.1
MYFDSVDEGTPIKTYEWLCHQINKHIENTRLAHNRNKMQQHLKQAVGSRNLAAPGPNAGPKGGRRGGTGRGDGGRTRGT